MFKIFITADVAKEAKEFLEKEFVVDIHPNMEEDELCKVIGEYDAVITRSQTKITKKVIHAATNLKVIGRAGVGIDGIDIPEATAKGITVVNTPESNTIAACEHTLALMLSITRYIPQAHQSIMEGRWDRKSFTGIQLLNKTVGIIGVGRVGSNVAKRLQAFNMKTIGYDPYIPLERGQQLGVDLVNLDTLLRESDYITLHTPLTEETKGMIGAKEIEKMKDGVRIVNASRGAVIDIDALAEALKTGKVAGAGIDVWTNRLTLLSSFRLAHSLSANLSASFVSMATRSGSPAKLGIGAPFLT